jgi:hypothetical protein
LAGGIDSLESILGLLKSLKIRALEVGEIIVAQWRTPVRWTNMAIVRLGLLGCWGTTGRLAEGCSVCWRSGDRFANGLQGVIGWLAEVAGEYYGLESRRFLIYCVKGTVSRDFLLLVFFMNQFPTSP